MEQKLRPDMDIGRNIRRLRKIKGISQADIIAKLGSDYNIHISQSTYSKLENNRMNIRVSELVAIKQILMEKGSYDEFFEGIELQSYKQ